MPIYEMTCITRSVVHAIGCMGFEDLGWWDFGTAEPREIDCPICGDGSVDTKLFENFDNQPVSIEVYGIADALTNTETFIRTVTPATILALITELRSARELLREAMGYWLPQSPESERAYLRIRASEFRCDFDEEYS